MGFMSNQQFDKFTENQKKNEEDNTSSYSQPDARMVRMQYPTEEGKVNNTYIMRLLYYIPNGSERNGPFIEKNTHEFYDTETHKRIVIVCPSTEYCFGKAGFSKCKVCGDNSANWKEWKDNKSSTAKELYDQFKRKMNGYAIVYMVKDPVMPENNGKVMILPYKKTIKKYFDKKIFGKFDEANPFGFKVFDLQNGHNLIVQVEKEPVQYGEKTVIFPKYNPEFAINSSSINIDEKTLETMILDLDFDSLYTKSTDSEILEFYEKYVLNESIESETNTQTPAVEGPNELPYSSDSEETVNESVETSGIDLDGLDSEINVDSILAGLNSGE